MARPPSPTSALSRRRALVRHGLAWTAVALLLVLLWTRWDHEAVLAWKEQAGPIPFFGALAVLPALGVPITPFFILAGAAFGVIVGLLGSLLALLINLMLCYWIARSALRPRIEKALLQFGYGMPNFDAGKTGALRFTLLVKLTPGVPAFVKNYLLGLAGVPFLLYIGVSMLITGVYAALLVVLGESVFEQDLDRGVVALVVLAATAALLWWLRSRRQETIDPEHQASGDRR